MVQYISCGGWEVAEMWDEEGGDGEDRVVPSEPDLVGPILPLSCCGSPRGKANK